jgi:hypothetical protein
MFHMLTCFNLKPDYTMDEFRQSVTNLTNHMQEIDLVHSTGSIGRRQRDTIMDTDSERDHEYFFIMSFRDRAQCDKAVDYLLPHEEPGESIHKAVYSKVRDQIFICWEDL